MPKRGRASVVLIWLSIACVVAIFALPFFWGTEARIAAPYETVVLEVGPLSFSTDVLFAELLLLFVEGILLAAYFLWFYFRAFRDANNA